MSFENFEEVGEVFFTRDETHIKRQDRFNEGSLLRYDFIVEQIIKTFQKWEHEILLRDNKREVLTVIFRRMEINIEKYK